MNRRRFCFALAAASTAVAKDPVKITRITLAPIEGRFHKFVAMNAYDRVPKGHTYPNTLVRIFTDQGVEGTGTMGYANPDPAFVASLKKLIGANPLDLYDITEGHITGRNPEFAPVLKGYRHLDSALYDLIGKLTNRPVWQLVGQAARERIEVYDATLYFSDIWYRDRGAGAVAEECEEAVKKGYLGVKLKLGRGWKWMGKEEGLLRDIEVCKTVRKAVGAGVKILVDANNGYQDDFDRAWRLLEGTADTRLYWMEEIFPETVEDYTRLRSRMQAAKITTLIADGESVDQPAEFAQFLKPNKLIDAVQMDIRRGGFLDNQEVAKMAEEGGAIHVPHNWGSQIGVLMALHMARAVRSVPMAEDDRSTCDVLNVEGYDFRGGFYTVADKPGLSISVDEKTYTMKYRAKETVIGS